MLRIGFCDDDLSVLNTLQVLLDRYRVDRNADLSSAAFQSPLELIAEIEKGLRFDILLLDVLMPGENGMEAARRFAGLTAVLKSFFSPPPRNLPWNPTP